MNRLHLEYVADKLEIRIADLDAWLFRNRAEHFAGILYSARSSNTKTGSVPSAAIGRSREESKRSCEGCSLLDSGDCYAQYGTPAMGHSSQTRSRDRRLADGRSVLRYDPYVAIADRWFGAQMVRFGSIGEPARSVRSDLYAGLYHAYQNELDPVGYSHMWRHEFAADLKPFFMASVDSEEEAEEAEELGWRTALVHRAPLSHWEDGRYVGPRRVAGGLVCPAMVNKTTCNDCTLCTSDPVRPERRAVLAKIKRIVFIEHGPKSTARQSRRGRK